MVPADMPYKHVQSVYIKTNFAEDPNLRIWAFLIEQLVELFSLNIMWQLAVKYAMKYRNYPALNATVWSFLILWFIHGLKSKYILAV